MQSNKAIMQRECINSGMGYWNGLLDWTTGLIFELKILQLQCMYEEV